LCESSPLGDALLTIRTVCFGWQRLQPLSLNDALASPDARRVHLRAAQLRSGGRHPRQHRPPGIQHAGRPMAGALGRTAARAGRRGATTGAGCHPLEVGVRPERHASTPRAERRIRRAGKHKSRRANTPSDLAVPGAVEGVEPPTLGGHGTSTATAPS